MEKFPFEKSWIYTDLAGIRESDDLGTYKKFRYEDLPKIEIELDAYFNWLKSYPIYLDEDRDYDFGEKVIEFQAAAEKKGLSLPVSFLNFINEPELIQRIRSNTDCFFELGDFIEKVPNYEDLYLLHFLSDSQACGFWYICMNTNGNHCIISSENLYCHKETVFADTDFKRVSNRIGYWVAPNFREFIFRQWIENEIWLNKWHGTKMSTIERKYLYHLYKNRNV